VKPTEKPDTQRPQTKPLRMRNAGLYGEVGVLPVSRSASTQFHQPKTFL
jgi:hypothetical protein